jgi:hypothetical protein
LARQQRTVYTFRYIFLFCQTSLLSNREAEALRTLAYYHAEGNERDPLVEFEFEEIKAAIRLDREVAANVGWLSLIKTPGNRRRMRIAIAIAFFSQWSGNGLVSYCNTFIYTAKLAIEVVKQI